MADARPSRAQNPKALSRFIPVRSSVAAARPAPSKIPRPLPQRATVGAVDPRVSRGGARSSSVRQQAQPRQSAPVLGPQPQPLPPEPQPPAPPPPSPRRSYHRISEEEMPEFMRQWSAELPHFPDTFVDVESIIPVRQARPPASAGSRRAPQPLTLPPDLQGPGAACGNPLAQPNYDLDWLPEDETWLTKQLQMAYTHEAVESIKAHQLRAAKQEVAEGTNENVVLYKMIESGVPFDVIDKFLVKGPEEEEAEKRETEHFEKLEKMITDEAHDIDLALTISRFELEKNPKRETRLDFDKAVRGRQQKQKFQRGLRSVRKGIEAMTVLAEEDEPEEVQPELAAAMMYTEECGPGMTNPPNDMFAFLFSHQPDVPPEQRGEPQGSQLVPTAPGEIAEQRSGRLARPDGATSPPPGRVSPDLPGARSQTQRTAGAPRHQSVWRSGRECRRGEITKRFNLVQMCGSHPPFWFRGYFEAFPHTVGKIAISKSPSMTLQTAWYLTRPETYPTNRRLMVQAA